MLNTRKLSLFILSHSKYLHKVSALTKHRVLTLSQMVHILHTVPGMVKDGIYFLRNRWFFQPCRVRTTGCSFFLLSFSERYKKFIRWKRIRFPEIWCYSLISFYVCTSYVSNTY